MSTEAAMASSPPPTQDLSAFEEVGHQAENRSFVEQAESLGLNWEVLQVPIRLSSEHHTGKIADWKALVRSDTGDILNVPKKRYTPVQPAQILDFFDVLRKDEDLTMDVVGILGGGKIIWGLAQTGRVISVDPSDPVKEYILVASSSDYSMSTLVKRTSVRVICQNTLELAIRLGDEGAGFLKRSHAGAFDFKYAREKIMAIRKDDAELERFQTEISKLSHHNVTEEQAEKYFTTLLFPGKKVEDVRANKRSSTRLDDALRMYHTAPGQELDTARGTAWGLLNTITYMTDHVSGKTPDSRMRSAFFAEGATLKEKARKAALKLVA